jgi:hypothetical protein
MTSPIPRHAAVPLAAFHRPAGGTRRSPTPSLGLHVEFLDAEVPIFQVAVDDRDGDGPERATRQVRER